MPELPEVETTRRGIAPHLEGHRVTGVVLRRPDLRWPIPPEISTLLPGQVIDEVDRRAKYLLLRRQARPCSTWACPACCACCRRRHRSANTTTSISPWIPGASCASPTRVASARCSGRCLARRTN